MSTATIHEPSVHPEWWREAPPAGLHRGIGYDEYSRWAAVNHSTLRHFAKSPLHARHAMLNPSEPTEAMALGSAVHKAILEPDLFPAAYCWAPKFDKRTNDGKAGWTEFQTENAGKGILTREEYDQCIALRDAVWLHPTAAEVLRSPGANELSATWMDKTTNAACKGRPDRFGLWQGWPTVTDVKTARDASRRAFSRAIEQYGYSEQAAFYLDGLESISPFEGDRRFIFIVAEKEPPYAVAVYELDIDAIEAGRRKYRAHLNQYAACLASGVWPGFGDGADLISMPAWAMREEEHY